MATLKGGYHTKDGAKVPSVTTILSRFKDSGGLIHWAWNLGKEGRDYREVRDNAASAGTIAHELVEQWVQTGLPLHALTLPEAPQELIDKASKAFGAFLEWADQTQLKITHTEMPLVSEKYRFGGTFDAILVKGKRAMGDWKTSNSIYGEYLAQIAAYAILWEENFPDQPIDGGYHLLRFDKEYGDFHAHWWAELEAGKRYFLAVLAAYKEDKELKARAK
jgi:hypothetical protein